MKEKVTFPFFYLGNERNDVMARRRRKDNEGSVRAVSDAVAWVFPYSETLQLISNLFYVIINTYREITR